MRQGFVTSLKHCHVSFVAIKLCANYVRITEVVILLKYGFISYNYIPSSYKTYPH